MNAKVELSKFQLLGARLYERVREDCHAIKNGYEDAIERWAERLAPCLPERCILVPIPGRFGYADFTLALAQECQRNAIMDGKRVVLSNCLACDAHEPLYDIKKRGETRAPAWLRMRANHKAYNALVEMMNDGFAVVLVDNVIDTGTTMVAAKRALHLKNINPGTGFILTVGASPAFFYNR